MVVSAFTALQQKYLKSPIFLHIEQNLICQSPILFFLVVGNHNQKTRSSSRLQCKKHNLLHNLNDYWELESITACFSGGD